MSICITVNNYNIFYLDEVLDYFRKLDIYAYLNYLHDNKAWNIKNLREDIKEAVKEKYEDLNLHPDDIKKINGAITFMNLEKSNIKHWNRFLDLTFNLDKIRDESFKEVFPELHKLISIDESNVKE